GMAAAQALGGSMTIGYLPDMFGHVAQMPQILRRAGMAAAQALGGSMTIGYLPDMFGHVAQMPQILRR
ncbi:hypothetical protein CTI14_72540, partial [Methylobacterium radiotolerans]